MLALTRWAMLSPKSFSMLSSAISSTLEGCADKDCGPRASKSFDLCQASDLDFRGVVLMLILHSARSTDVAGYPLSGR
jgi:hypothetical protein